MSRTCGREVKGRQRSHARIDLMTLVLYPVANGKTMSRSIVHHTLKYGLIVSISTRDWNSDG